jgi:limonene-1,2-epoxide hydrolase
MSNSDIVRAFVAAWEARSVEGILDLMTPDARWQNVGLPEAVGREQIRQMAAPFIASATMVRFDVRHIAETADGVVLTERTDVFDIDGKILSAPVMGVFEFKDGKI